MPGSATASPIATETATARNHHHHHHHHHHHRPGSRHLPIPIETIERRVFATRRDLFVPATVDPRPSRAVHCPDLNACLINESRIGLDEIDCRAVHFGYAIPVNVVPIKESPNLVELVLDHSSELSTRTTSFLLNHHPQLREQQRHQQQQQKQEQEERVQEQHYLGYQVEEEFLKMAATAKHDLRRKFPTETSSSGDEDIAAIAKQISDHAEAIYQTWKSRGLEPTEILNCHSNATAADKFGSALTPTTSPASSSGKTIETLNATSPNSAVDILAQTPNLDNGNLEKLVNNFVVEDKARIAASSQRSPSKTLPSSIQFALQKFERNSTQQQHQQTSPLKGNGSIGSSNVTKQSNKQTNSSLHSPTLSFPNKPSQIVKPQVSTKVPSAHHQEVFLETIETTFPADLTPSKIVQQKRPASTVVISSSMNSSLNSDGAGSNPGLTTWPLKNKLSDGKRSNDNSPTSGRTTPTSPQDGKIMSIVKDSSKSLVRGRSNRLVSDDAFLDEVAREEERLINALKTGSVITEEPSERTSSSIFQLAARQKPAIKKEKPKVEPVKPIIIGHNHEGVTLIPTSVALVNNVTSSVNTGNNTEGMTKSLSKDELSNMSVVDYAKVRYRAAQQNSPGQQRLEEQKSVVNVGTTYSATEQLVSSARSKFEPELRKDNNKEGNVKDDRDPITSRWGPRINSPRPRLEQVPHPELTTQQKQHIRAAAATGTGNNPVRPFLTRGSVAERVLIFEKCPSELLLDKRGPRPAGIATWRTGHEVQSKVQSYVKEKTQQKSLPPHTTLQRHVKANRNVHIPRFYFPGGKPTPLSQLEATISRITTAFQSLPGHRASRAQFHLITKACDLPLYWKVPLFLAANKDQTEHVEMNTFLEFWKELTSTHHDAASKFIRITTRGLRNNILPEDLIPLVQDVVETHPGLTFLKEAKEFHSRYVHTVIARIFYCVNRSWSGKISVAELRRSNLLAVIAVLEHEEDINQVTAYFSYEHFYVIYCKFWELDRDHDLFIDKMDLTRHNDNALSTRMIERIFSGAVTRGGVKSGGVIQQPEDKMSYTEFVWFLLSEEDKNHPTAIEYWFRCMDLDGDGYLSMFELEYFYEEQLHRMEGIGLETLPFEDCLCQMLDMIHPATPGKISLSDLKKCKMTSIFFDTFFNLEKYLDHEQRDPFASARDGHEMSDWDRFAAEEYELLVAEESGNDQKEQTSYDSTSEDTFSPNLDVLVGEPVDVVSQGTDVLSKTHNDNLSSSVVRDQSRNQHYDSGDSDDYADSDN
ncbi:uncharacterized protein LOC124422960 isoform X1 [Vespa crabro]|uniref:uncharacterized protein LOC124422960 isoform X1 n=1 Tax=Vespa crabro TaxID=7445 RepID=UPI001F022860|nr:uncharacterized protein LOC124422960 isoform X1 [Vespa crabro]XP_046816083.1 uncharacterized protein LOC124422960 isoform X1 [Vespa crabro]XP_046816084.1 uncharacterized protein LOC124422960 isoform X1 [Vespa crabro]